MNGVLEKQDQNEAQDTWTIMLYLSGDNNLSPEMVRALTDIKMQGVPPGITFTIQYDPEAPGFPTFRYAITSAKTSPEETLEDALKSEADGPLPIPEYLVKRLKDEDSADPRVLARFIRWSARDYPSKYRMLILSGHGSGALGDFLSDDNARRGQPGSLTIPRLAEALKLALEGAPDEKSAGKDEDDAKDTGCLVGILEDKTLYSGGERCLLHILGMDSCLMGMAEVGYEVRERVERMVGSEGFLPNAGWPYAYLLKQLKTRKNEGMKPKDVAERLVEDVIAYYEQYIPAGTSLDIASCELTKLEGVVETVKNLTEALRLPDKSDNELSDREKTVRDLVIAAHWRAQSYKFEQYTDLWDFCDRLEDGASRLSTQLQEAAVLNRGGGIVGNQCQETEAHKQLEQITGACKKVKGAVESLAEPSEHTGPDFQHSHGLAVLFPWSTSTLGGNKALKDYGELEFPAKSGWSAFLNAYLKSSEREPRKNDGALLRGTQRPVLAPVPASGKHAEGASKHAEGASKFADLILRLCAPGGTTLPWSMKNPPQGVRWPGQGLRKYKKVEPTATSGVVSRPQVPFAPPVETFEQLGNRPKQP